MLISVPSWGGSDFLTAPTPTPTPTPTKAMEKDVTLAGGLGTDRIRVYRPLTGAKDYSRAKLRENYEKVTVDRAKG